MFEQTILIACARPGGAKTDEQYELARRRQPNDCTLEACPHRDRIRPTDLEWQHQLRREQYRLKAKENKITLKEGRWKLLQ